MADWFHILGPCVGNTRSIGRIGFGGFCLGDSPVGVRFARNVSSFPAAVNAASTWNRTLMYHHNITPTKSVSLDKDIYERAAAMGREFYDKGVHIALAPMMNIVRSP